MEIKHSPQNLYLNKAFLKLPKNFPQTEHVSQMKALQ